MLGNAREKKGMMKVPGIYSGYVAVVFDSGKTISEYGGWEFVDFGISDYFDVFFSEGLEDAELEATDSGEGGEDFHGEYTKQ